MVSAWYGGRGPGLLATVVGSVAANYFLLAPTGSFSNAPEDLVKTVTFLIVGGQISWLSGALHSAKRRAELDAEAARRGEQLYRTLAHNFPNGAVFLLDTSMRVVLAEGAALDAAGSGADRIRDLPLMEAFPRRVLGTVAPLLRSASGGSTEIQFRDRVYLVQVVPLRGTAGVRFAGMGIAEDVTEVATARVALQQAHDELEIRVAERTAELQFQPRCWKPRAMRRSTAFSLRRMRAESSFTIVHCWNSGGFPKARLQDHGMKRLSQCDKS